MNARHEEQESRLNALWRVVTNPVRDDADVLEVMVREGAAGLRPGDDFAGMFGRLEGTEIVAEAIFNGGVAPEHTSTFIEMLRSGVTQSWTDTSRDEVASLQRQSISACRSIIATPVSACGSSYFLSFGSLAPIAEAFTDEDHRYVELLASMFATHVHARWQSDRLRYQCEHDALTGLRNRVHFRSAGRLALLREGCGAIAVINIDRFRSVNERYGCLIGDSVLVEVAAALEQRATGGEFVARLDGDAFGIYFPGGRSRDVVERRTAAIAEAFDHPFSTGDRNGKRTIRVTATAGVAVAPDDGDTFEEILARAEAAVFASKGEHPAGRGTLQ